MMLDENPKHPPETAPSSGDLPPERRILQTLIHQKRATLWLLALAVFYTLYFAKSLLVPILLALYLATILQPIVRKLTLVKMPVSVGAAVTVLLFISVLALGFVQLSAPARDWVERVPRFLEEAEHKLDRLRKTIREAQETTERLEDIAGGGEKERVVVKGPGLAQQAAGHFRDFGFTVIVVLVLLYLFLARGEIFLSRIAEALGEKRGYMKLFGEMRHELARYLLTIGLINISLGIITTGLTALLGLPNPYLWGAVAGLLNFIPYLGGAVTVGILTIVSFFTFDTWLKIVSPPLAFALLNGLEGYLITPMIIGKRLTMNPIFVFIFLIFWGWIWGIFGIFLAMPILMALNVFSQKLETLEVIRNVGDV